MKKVRWKDECICTLCKQRQMLCRGSSLCWVDWCTTFQTPTSAAAAVFLFFVFLSLTAKLIKWWNQLLSENCKFLLSSTAKDSSTLISPRTQVIVLLFFCFFVLREQHCRTKHEHFGNQAVTVSAKQNSCSQIRVYDSLHHLSYKSGSVLTLTCSFSRHIIAEWFNHGPDGTLSGQERFVKVWCW